eukprot:scaffold15577_cov35-Tisochrysis_lutea.AAC.3
MDDSASAAEKKRNVWSFACVRAVPKQLLDGRHGRLPVVPRRFRARELHVLWLTHATSTEHLELHAVHARASVGVDDGHIASDTVHHVGHVRHIEWRLNHGRVIHVDHAHNLLPGGRSLCLRADSECERVV